MQRLVPRNRKAQYATEVMGLLAQSNSGYFPPELVDACLKRLVTPPPQFKFIWIGVDPANHSRSLMACVAVGVTDDGVHVILAACSINVSRCEAMQIASIVRHFGNGVQVQYPQAKLVPIVEVNGSEVLAQTIVTAFGQNTVMPFVKERFASYICPGIGVVTSKDTKMACIQALYMLLIDGRLCVSETATTTSRKAFDPRAEPGDLGETIDELGQQLTRFSDQPDGTTSGKGSGGLEDDMAMALMICVYWRMACVNSNRPF